MKVDKTHFDIELLEEKIDALMKIVKKLSSEWKDNLNNNSSQGNVSYVNFFIDLYIYINIYIQTNSIYMYQLYTIYNIYILIPQIKVKKYEPFSDDFYDFETVEESKRERFIYLFIYFFLENI